MYATHMPYDPEGVLGSINSVLMAFLGLQVCAWHFYLFLLVSCFDPNDVRIVNNSDGSVDQATGIKCFDPILIASRLEK